MKKEQIFYWGKLGIFLLTAVVCLTVPTLQILKYHDIETSGEKLIFRLEGYDPYDIFRGRYLQIRLHPSEYTIQDPAELKKWEKQTYSSIFVKFEAGKDGFAEIKQIFGEKPEDGTNCWKIKTGYISGNDLHLNYPIDRFYLNEDLAEPGEDVLQKQLRRQARDSNGNADQNDRIKAVIRLKDGTAVLEDILIGKENTPIAEYCRKLLREEKKKE